MTWHDDVTYVVSLFVAVSRRVDDSRQSKVGDLDNQFVGNEHVTGRQVAVDYLHV